MNTTTKPTLTLAGRLELNTLIDARESALIRLSRGEPGAETAFGDAVRALMAWVDEHTDWSAA